MMTAELTEYERESLELIAKLEVERAEIHKRLNKATDALKELTRKRTALEQALEAYRVSQLGAMREGKP